jgi:ABC-type amino acid transport system permease subunit
MSSAATVDRALGALIILFLAALLAGFASRFTDLTLRVMPVRPPVEAFYWTFRGFDVLLQAFLILAAAAAVAAFFRADPEKPPREEAFVEEAE